MAEAEQISELTKQRRILKARLTRFKSFFNSFLNSFSEQQKSIVELKLRLSKFEPSWDEFESVQTQIELLDSSDAQSLERESFEESYIQIVAQVQDFIDVREPQNNQCTITHNNDISHNIRVKLPVIQLPHFEGAYENWTTFYDTFNALIHSDNSLSDIQKFHYLKSSLKGEAYNTIQSLEISAANYQIAWNLLIERYQNKRVIIQRHMTALFNLNHIHKESAINLRKLSDTAVKHLNALQTLGISTNHCDPFIVYLISNKLDTVTLRDWENHTQAIRPCEYPKLDDLLTFIKQKCCVLESLDRNKLSHDAAPERGHNLHKSNFPKGHITSHVVSQSSCVHCKQSHHIFACPQFLRLKVPDRIKLVKELNCCLNCLRQGHIASKCQSGSCKTCNRKHNSLLHLNSNASDPNSSNSSRTNFESGDSHSVIEGSTNRSFANTSLSRIHNSTLKTTKSDQPSSSVISNYGHSSFTSNVLLSTIILNIVDAYGNHHPCRALLDSGSQVSFISETMCQQLGFKKSKANIPITGINQSKSTISHYTNVVVHSRTTDYYTTLNCLVLPKITQILPSFQIDHTHVDVPSQLPLADPHYYKPNKIDMLLGANVFWDVLGTNRLKLSNSLFLQETSFGWILSGTIDNELCISNSSVCNNFTVCSFSCSLDKQLEQFWRIEDCQSDDKLTAEEQAAEQHFVNTHSRDQNGRFVVSLPFRKDLSSLGDSREIALKRFLSLERRLQDDPRLKSLYVNFMNEYKNLGHMKLVSTESISIPHYYLPHHPVMKYTNNVPKIRVVFDGSCATSSGLSLNNILMVGPTIQQDIFSLLARFRVHQYVLTSDVVKMYRQVKVDDYSSHFQLIFWREDSSHDLQTFALTTVTYGTSSAPFLAIRAMQQLAIECRAAFPRASKVIIHDTYVDDILTGSNSISELIAIRDELITCLHTGGFSLGKWCSNNDSVLDGLPSENIEQKTLTFHNGINAKQALGVSWNPQDDTFHFIPNVVIPSVITKRVVISQIARIFDPLGLIGPVIVLFKLFIQSLWKAHLEWDQPLPENLSSLWLTYLQSLTSLENLCIPRFLQITDESRVEIHGFCDASERAYGACVYIKAIGTDITVSLIASKSRVAPMKQITLPRLELCGALLLSQLVHKVINSLDITVDKCYYWTDSMIVISWISAPCTKWKTFVASRVEKIQALTTHGTWQHVKSEDNPADFISRGVMPSQLLHPDHIWWTGPPWLRNRNDRSSHDTSHNIDLVLPDTRQAFTVHVSDSGNELFNRFSTFSKLRRVMAYCLRFISNCKRDTQHRNVDKLLSVDELKQATYRLIRLAQRQVFHDECRNLELRQTICSKSIILNLNPFIDDNQLLRVGGRISNANVPYSQKFPIILPPKHILTQLILTHIHINHFHAGPQTVLAIARLNYWPINGKRLIKSIIHKCITCFRNNPTKLSQLMGNLPGPRVQPSRPFTHCGVDFAGPIHIKASKLRNAKFLKCYIALFICFSTKAVHLELVNDLSTDAFISALKRFTSRRGLCSDIYSDNGTTFVGTNRTLRELVEMFNQQASRTKLNDFLIENSIKWHFIPPRAPNFGGLWEAAIKSCKFHLKRILGNAYLTFEDMNTVLCQIECCLNSRPLVPMSSHPDDLTSLTPGHFLIGNSLAAIPEPDMSGTPSNRLSHYQRLQQLIQNFWRRWQIEYLHSLQPRGKHLKTHQNLQIGKLVLIHQEGLPPTKWLLGRVTELHTGDDQRVRVATVKTASGTFKRAISKLSPLPIQSSD